jgi:2,4-dienoyl-CoA reductase (NADPH2)
LLAPGAINRLALRNRIFMCPMGDSLADADGTVSDRQLAYFEARAAGGAALLLVGSVSVAYPAGSYAATQTAASHDRFVPGLRRLAQRAHDHGARIAAQLVHDGGNSLHDIEQGRPLLVPSLPNRPRPDRISRMLTADEQEQMLRPFVSPDSKVDYRIATEADLEGVIDMYASSAARCIDAGFDAIELHGGHGYLLDAFRSGYANTRDDDWGGSVEGRCRLMLDTIRAVRARVGPDIAVWMRLNAFELGREGGATLDETRWLAPHLVAAGLDALHVSAYASNDLAIGVTSTHTPHTPGELVPYAAAVKSVVDVPVITFGRIEPDDADALIERGDADFVAMGRKLLADPSLPNKLAAGRIDDVRPCIYQYRCIGNIFVRGSVACVSNPETAREADLRVEHSSSPRRILVVGGGPAGLEASRRLAEAGHSVTLAERATTLGGRLAIGARADDVLDRFLGWLAHSADQSGVDIVLGVDVDVEFARTFDEVVIATGASWDRPTVPGAERAHVRTIDQLAPWLHGTEALGPRLAFLGGGKIALTLAAHALAFGHDVTIVEPSGVFGVELGLPGRFRLVHDVEQVGAQLITGAWTAISETAVSVQVEAHVQEVAADNVIVAHGARAIAPLADAMRAAGIACHRIGDCREVNRIEGAMLDAAHLARTI